MVPGRRHLLLQNIQNNTNITIYITCIFLISIYKLYIYICKYNIYICNSHVRMNMIKYDKNSGGNSDTCLWFPVSMVPRNTLEKSLMSKFLGTTDIASFALLDSSISLHLGTMDTLSLHLGTTDTLCTGLHNTVCLWFLGTTDSNWEPRTKTST